MGNLEKMYYYYDPMFSDREVWANSLDPDQTAQAQTQLIILSASFRHVPNLIITAIFGGFRFLGDF